MSGPADTATGFDAWASTYQHSVLQPTLYVPAQQRALQLAGQLMARPRRVLDVGCGTGRLLRQARQQYPSAVLIGMDLAWGMVATAAETTPAELAIRHVRAATEQLPFADHTFDLVVVTMSLRHWTDVAAGIAQIDRVLIQGGVLVVADVFPHPPAPRPARRGAMAQRPSPQPGACRTRGRADRQRADGGRLRPDGMVPVARHPRHRRSKPLRPHSTTPRPDPEVGEAAVVHPVPVATDGDV
jgi:ubiquinone/menaquinone biosynthesis C-methylase UbiE